MIYVIGDSHSSLFNGYDGKKGHFIQPQYGHCYKIQNGKFIILNQPHNPFLQNDPNFTAIRTGPNTAYNMITKTGMVDEIIKEYKICKEKDYILFVYGEIDTRMHIGKQEELGRNVRGVINEIADRYFDFVKKYKNEGYSVLVWGVPPSGISDNKAHHLYNSPKKRNVLSKLMNEQFNNRCQTLDINFISIWDNIVSEGDYYHYFQDAIHLSYVACKDLINQKLKSYYE